MTARSPRELALELAQALRDEVLPMLGRHEGRAHAGAGGGGDVTFAIDERAEALMERFLAERAPERRLLLRGPGHGLAREASRPGCSSSTRSTGRARRWPVSSPPASRSPRRRSDVRAAMRDVEAGLHRRDQVGAVFVRRARRAARARPARCPQHRPGADVLGLRAARAARRGDGRGAGRADRRLLGRRRRRSTSARRAST